MNNSESRLNYLYQQWLAKTATEAERQEFLLLLNSTNLENELAPFMKEAWSKTSEEEGLFTTEQKNKLANIIIDAAPAEDQPAPVIHRVHFLRRSWFRYAAAIVVLAVAAITFLLTKKTTHKTDIVVSNVPAIQPAKERAILTLADGSQIVLDSASNGTLAQQGNARVVKLANGQIAYNLQGAAEAELMNTMRIPRGGQYQLTLPDGSRVWLNAESSITFPAAFTSNARKVKITGEAYFEVVKDAAKPFKVEADDQTIEVLGTSFNVNSYRDEDGVKSSLITGSIKLSSKATDAILKPGQAFVDGKIVPTDIAQDIAWKNGAFDFNGKTIQSVLKEIQRWYDLDIQYKGAKPVFRLKGGMERGLQLDAVLNILKMHGLDIQLEGRKLIITEKENG